MNRLPRSVIGACLGLLLLVVSAPACSKSEETSVTLYSGRTADLVQPMLDDFTKETGIKVNFLPGDSADLAITIAEEGADTKADVFLSQSPGAMGRVEAEGRLLPLPEDLLTKLTDPSLASPDRTWLSVSGRQRVLVYNTGAVTDADLPASVLDVAKGNLRLGVAPTNGSFQDFVTALRLDKGDDATRAWLGELADTGARVYPNNTAIVEAVARGEIDAGLVNHYYALRKLDEEPAAPIANHTFAGTDPGSLLLVTSAGVIDHGDKKRTEAANKLVEYMLSDDAQRYFADETFEYPLAKGIAPAKDVPPLKDLRADRVDVTALEGGLEATVEMIRTTGLAA